MGESARELVPVADARPHPAHVLFHLRRERTLLNVWRQNINVERPEKARTKGPRGLDDTKCKESDRMLGFREGIHAHWTREEACSTRRQPDIGIP